MNFDNFTVVYMVRVGGLLSCMDFDYGIWPTSEKEGRCRFIIVTLVYDIMAFITSQSSIGIPNVATNS